MLHNKEKFIGVQFFNTNDSDEVIQECLIQIMTDKNWYLAELYNTEIQTRVTKSVVNMKPAKLWPNKMGMKGPRGKNDWYRCYKIDAVSTARHQLISLIDEIEDQLTDLQEGHDIYLIGNSSNEIVRAFLRKRRENTPWEKLAKQLGDSKYVDPYTITPLTLNGAQVEVFNRYLKTIHQYNASQINYSANKKYKLAYEA